VQAVVLAQRRELLGYGFHVHGAALLDGCDSLTLISYLLDELRQTRIRRQLRALLAARDRAGQHENCWENRMSQCGRHRHPPCYRVAVFLPLFAR
jgi:hypothetical protein